MIRAPVARPRAEVPEALLRHRPLVNETMARAVSRLSPHLQRVASYHLGWQDASGTPIDGDGGKAVRAAIVLLAAESVGADAVDAAAGAVALELVHNFSLIHDDVMDGDGERRHRPTVWALFGVAEAVVVGDALHALAQELLLEETGAFGARAALELDRATAEMIRGQAEDLALESRLDVTVEECIAMSSHKTGALLACAGALGALRGGGGELQVEALRAYGRHVGVAFQAVDDVLGIWGEPPVTGKPAASDLRQHKKTLPLAHALSAGGERSAQLARALSNGPVDETEARELVKVLDDLGARAWTLDLAARHLDQALRSLGAADLRPGPAKDLREVALFVTRRDF